MKNYIIQTASIDDLNFMKDSAQREGWNPGLHDMIPFHVTDPTGFLIGHLNDEPIACISVVRYITQFAFLGFYIVKPEYRGHGYGFNLWQQAMHYLQNYNVGLDGVIAQQNNYQKSGFKFSHRHIRFSGLAPKN